MRNRGEEPEFEKFRQLFAPVWDALKARLARIDRRLYDLEQGLADLESTRSVRDDLDELQQRFDFEVAEGRFVPLDLEDLRARVVGPEELEGCDQGELDGA